MSYENNSAGKYFDLLPVEIQLNILEYVGIMNDCYLVCRKFQELCCLKRSDKFVLRLNTKMLTNASTMNSILMSNRKIMKLNVSEIRLSKAKNFNFLMNVVMKFSTSIQQYEMLYCTTTYSDMVCILNQLINTKILLLVSIKSYERVQNKPQIIIKLNLSKLKQLCVRSCTSNIEQLLIGLPEGVLNELHIHDKSNFNIQTLTQMQKNIKKMICYSGVDDFMPWKNLKLIHLDIGKSVKNNHFDSILNITTLEELLLNTSKVSANVFARIYKLSNLKVLSLYNLMMTQIKELACIQSLKRLESLNLHGHRGQLMEEHLTQISENLTNLKEIRLDFEFLSNKIAHAFLKNCKQLKVMEMIAPATIQNFNDTICQQGLENLQLEELTIYYGLHNNQLVNMLTRKCPNLKKLVLFGTIVNDRCLWNLLLTLNLKSVYIENQSFLSIEAKMFLSKFGNDLMEII